MGREHENVEKFFRATRLLGLVVILFVCFLVFVLAVLAKGVLPRKIPAVVISKTDVANRGSIYSSDGYILANSSKLYKISINPQSINPAKKDLFVNLLSIYGNLKKEDILKALAKKGYVTISYKVPATVAANLRLLNIKFIGLDVFQEYTDARGKLIQKMGLDIQDSGINRIYPLQNAIEPTIGYVRKIESGRITRVEGVKGIENYRDGILSSKRDGRVTGRRDIGDNIILNKSSEIVSREDGFNIVLSIPLDLQIRVEKLLKEANDKYKSREMIAGIMDPKTGQMLVLASSNTFNPNLIKKEDYPSLNSSAVETSYEPGSTIKPMIYSYLWEHGLLDPNKIIDLNNGVYNLRGYTIRDSSPLAKAKTKEILIRSSNIGMMKLTQGLSGQQMYDIFKNFELSTITGIDLPYEQNGILPSISLLNREVYKATVSYGYGLRVTFMQLLRAYASFSNGGLLMKPTITKYFIAPDGEKFRAKPEVPKRVLTQDIANGMEGLLHEVVTSGTGRRANVTGVIVGGKTGTARETKKGRYGDLYIGSFFGYAKDDSNTYTIGVVTFGSHSNEEYYAAQTAAPVFSEIVKLLINEGYLKGSSKFDKKK
ncbi:penicillin-binding protein [Helicobacter sp. 11S02629-2]|nr:penicillin-binding protein [Helicobacter sp. 11S02629-2]